MVKEIWKDIKGYDGLYQISNYGRVKSKKRLLLIKTKFKTSQRETKECILKPRNNGKNYIHYALNKNGITKEYTAHRLVAEAFIPNLENKPQINHKDMNTQNNYVGNLEWCTNGENQKHSYLNNKQRKNFFKENNPRKK